MRVVLRGHEPRWLAPASLVAAVRSPGLTAIPIRLAGANPMAAFERYLITPLTSVAGVHEVLLTATPLLFTGMAVAIAFRAGYWNIGAEGQFLLGAIGTTAVGTGLPGLPAGVALPLGFVAGALGGLLWAVVPAWLKRKFGIDEVVTTLLLNPVALLVVQGLLNGPWRNSERVHRLRPAGSRLRPARPVAGQPRALGLRARGRGDRGVRRRAEPYRDRCPDQRRRAGAKAADFSGIAVGRLQFRCALVSGAVAGLGGASQVMGVQHQLTSGISNNYGYTGVIVATLGGLSALGVFLVVPARRHRGGSPERLARAPGPAQLGAMFGALLLLAVLSAMSWRRYRVQWRTPAPAPAREKELVG